MILLGPVHQATRKKFKRCALLSSDIPGPEGTKELIDFGRRIGARREWLRHMDTPQECIAIHDNTITMALRAGAKEATTEELVRSVTLKEDYLRKTNG